MLTDPPLWRELIQIPDYAAAERRISPRWLQSIGFVAETRPSTYRLDVATVEAPDLTLFVTVTFVGSFETILIGNQYRSGGKSQALCTTSRRPVSRGELLDLLDWLQSQAPRPVTHQTTFFTTMSVTWYDVSDAEHLPEPGECVLVYNPQMPSHPVWVAYLYEDVWLYADGGSCVTPTHWTPLPAGPGIASGPTEEVRSDG